MALPADRNAALTLDPFHDSATPELAPAFRTLVADEESREKAQAAGSMGKAWVHGMRFNHLHMLDAGLMPAKGFRRTFGDLAFCHDRPQAQAAFVSSSAKPQNMPDCSGGAVATGCRWSRYSRQMAKKAA